MFEKQRSGEPAVSAPRRHFRPRRIAMGAVAIVFLAAVFVALGGWSFVGSMRGPSEPFSLRQAPPAPDYARPQAWLAYPGRNGLERSAPAGLAVVDEKTAPVDVFFIEPTTYHGSDVWNAPFDFSDEEASYDAPVLIGQASVFAGCCRIYAPRYRQVTVGALDKSPEALALAYGDVAAAFRHYLAHENRGRPFIIASHSQGTIHAVRLLQEAVLGTPLQPKLVAAYLIGQYVPANFDELGLPTCAMPRQTGCVLSYNTSQRGRSGARMLVDNKTYWWRGAPKDNDQAPALCVNPLTWNSRDAAPKEANPGSLPFPKAPFGTRPRPLTLVPALTGAVCRNDLLEVDISWSSPSGFHDKLSLLFGSYHLNDYGIFYAALRSNAQARVDAWLERQASQAAAENASASAP